VRIVVGLAPGGTADIVARLMAQWLSERLGQQFVVENRTGATGNIAAEAVVHAPQDGYTLLVVLTAYTSNVALNEKPNFNFIHDIVPVAGLVRVPHVLLVHPSVPATTVPELIAYAKRNPAKLSFGSAGNASTIHIAGALFNMMAGINMLHVPYRGVMPALTDLLGGQVQVVFATQPDAVESIKAGKVRALAVTTTTRSDVLPDIPTVADFLPGYEVSTWNGLGAPRNTPEEIVAKLNKEINEALADPKIKGRLADLGAPPMALTASEFGKLIVAETEKWAKVITFAGIKPQ
jgi:tripartite-type tricarboxylate transporter receptor subunit TctC